MINMPGFKKLYLRDWRQFRFVDMDVHSRLTVITGSNGAGKSSILNIFSQHFGFGRPYLSTPKPNKEGGFFYDLGLRKEKKLYSSDYENYLESQTYKNDKEDKEDEEDDFLLPQPTGQFIEFGKIVYSNDIESPIGVNEYQHQSYGIQINNQQHVVGVHVGSHRALTNYQPIQNISLQPMKAAQAYGLFNQELMTRYGGGNTGYSPIYRMKEALIGMAAFGEGNSYLQADSEVLGIFKGFIEVLRKVLPEEIGFRSLTIRIPDVVLQTKSGDFLIDSSSGGVNAIIEIAWQIYIFSKSQISAGQSNFVITMDEPENHLHPSMQRAIMPNLLDAFPQAQFIVATHSPFVVSAVEDSTVYVLNYSGKHSSSSSDIEALPEKRKVTSVKLDRVHKGGSAGEILREVLGVPVTTPAWVQDKVDVILANYIGKPISNNLLNALRADLSNQGFGELYPEALSKLVEVNE